MEKLPHQEYRDDLADKVKKLRKEGDKDGAKILLEEQQSTDEYTSSEKVQRQNFSFTKQLKDESYLAEEYKKSLSRFKDDEAHPDWLVEKREKMEAEWWDTEQHFQESRRVYDFLKSKDITLINKEVKTTSYNVEDGISITILQRVISEMPEFSDLALRKEGTDELKKIQGTKPEIFKQGFSNHIVSRLEMDQSGDLIKRFNTLVEQARSNMETAHINFIDSCCANIQERNLLQSKTEDISVGQILEDVKDKLESGDEEFKNFIGEQLFNFFTHRTFSSEEFEDIMGRSISQEEREKRSFSNLDNEEIIKLLKGMNIDSEIKDLFGIGTVNRNYGDGDILFKNIFRRTDLYPKEIKSGWLPYMESSFYDELRLVESDPENVSKVLKAIQSITAVLEGENVSPAVKEYAREFVNNTFSKYLADKEGVLDAIIENGMIGIFNGTALMELAIREGRDFNVKLSIIENNSTIDLEKFQISGEKSLFNDSPEKETLESSAVDKIFDKMMEKIEIQTSNFPFESNEGWKVIKFLEQALDNGVVINDWQEKIGLIMNIKTPEVWASDIRRNYFAAIGRLEANIKIKMETEKKFEEVGFVCRGNKSGSTEMYLDGKLIGVAKNPIFSDKPTDGNKIVWLEVDSIDESRLRGSQMIYKIMSVEIGNPTPKEVYEVHAYEKESSVRLSAPEISEDGKITTTSIIDGEVIKKEF